MLIEARLGMTTLGTTAGETDTGRRLLSGKLLKSPIRPISLNH